MCNTIYLLIIIILVIFIIYLIYDYYHNKNNKNNEIIEKFTSLQTTTLINLGGNPLVSRNQNNNITVSPSNTGSMNVNIGSDNSDKGWQPPSIDNASLTLSLSKLTKITALAVSGIRGFRLYFSKSDSSENSFEEVLYTSKNNTDIASSDGALVFEADTPESITIFTNLISTSKETVFAKYLKLIPFNYTSNPQYESTLSTTPSPSNVIHENGLKLEVFGIEPAAKPATGGKSLAGSYKLYTENDTEITNNIWTGEVGNNNKYLKIKFGKIVNGTFNTEPKTIYNFTFAANINSDNSYVQTLKLQYSHFKSKFVESIENINANTNFSSNTISNQFQYIFEYPIIATELIIIPTQISKTAKQPEIKIVDIKGDDVSTVQEQVLLDKNKNKYCSSDNVDGCGSISDLLGKQSEIQQLCDALELQDQIKENNQRIQKNRQYILQLEEQDKKIANLEQVVDKMKHLRELRQKENDGALMAQKDKQSKIDKQIQELVKDRKNKLKHINLNVNLNGDSLNKLEEAAAQVPTGDNTGTTSVEGFENFIGFVPKTNPTQTSMTTSMTQKPSDIPFYDYSGGFYYRPYADDSYVKQAEEEEQPDFRVIGLQDAAYKYEKPCASFFENKAMTCAGNKCDNNVKMLKQIL